jgi:hypothetical protein
VEIGQTAKHTFKKSIKMDSIETYTKAITENMEKLLMENEKILQILSSEKPELADQIMRDVNDTIKAMKNNDIDRINQIYERYANHTDK